mmetsp:Transcript_22391/g.39681  ORF Transcript_22391/g.39681 Transcript_22391/m.39681 type:complete len:275 (-) Transcript_22391:48-872(-)
MGDEAFADALAAFQQDIAELDNGKAEEGERQIDTNQLAAQEVQEQKGKEEVLDQKADERQQPLKRKADMIQQTVAVSSEPQFSEEYLEALNAVSTTGRPTFKKPKLTDDDHELSREEKAASTAAAAKQAGEEAEAASNAQANANPGKKKRFLRTAAGKVWEDPTLSEWPEGDFRIWVGNLAKECTDAMLSQAFAAYPTFNMARVTKIKKTGECRGFGFVSFQDPMMMVKAMREMQGKYIGARRVTLKRSQAEKRNLNHVRRKEKKFEKLVKKLT